jgi:uncharacterized protein (TIGR02284 family)
MEQTKQEVIETLNEMIKACRDGEEGFRFATEHVKSRDLGKLFQIYSNQRRQFAVELQAEIYLLGGEPDNSGTLGGALRRGWMQMRRSIGTDQDDEIISECERAEDESMRKYEEALTNYLPEDVRTVLSRQYNKIKDTHDRIRTLEKVNAVLH